MIAVVTGASGFVGWNLVGRLRSDGHEVRCLIRPMGGQLPERVKRTVVQYEDPSSLLKCDALDGADVVFHLAGATRARSVREFFAANVTPTRNLLGALAARRLSPRFIFVSSQAAAGPAPSSTRPVDEDDIPQPVEAYGRSKLEAERIVESFAARIPATIIRLCAVFGPRDRDFFAMFRMAERGLVFYPGVASHWLSLLHVDDAVSGMLTAARHPSAANRKYFLAPESAVQWRTLGGLIEQAARRPARHVDIPTILVRAAAHVGDAVGWLTGYVPLANSSKAALSRHRYWVCSASRAREELAFAPERSLPDAVRDTYYWYRQSGWLGGGGSRRPR